MTLLPLNFRECSLSDLGVLRYSFSRGELPQSRQPLLVIRLEGEASNDNDDMFDLASAIVMAGLEAWQPWSAILDLRALDYSWGDRMQNVLDAPQRWHVALYPIRRVFAGERLPEQFPTAFIASDLNHAGLEGLITQMMHLKSDDLLFESIEEAVRVLDRTLQGVNLV